MRKWLIIYDICDAKRLQVVAKVLEGYGIRVQKSVFELEASRKVIRKLKGKFNTIIEDEDYIIIFPLCERDWQKREKYGKGEGLNPEVESYQIF